MTMLSQEDGQVVGRKFCLQQGIAVFAVVLMGFTSVVVQAQNEDASCPCFTYEEVEAIFLQAEKLTAEGGASDCHIADYSVECNAEVVIWDPDYAVLAQARIDWFDFDPSSCGYIDSVGNPNVERNVSWPHPAPEATARACYDIISRVISKLDSSGKCETYP